MAQNDPDFEVRKDKLEQSIAKCRKTISVIEVKLQKVLTRVQKNSNRKKLQTKRCRVPQENESAMNQSTISVSLLDLTNMTDFSAQQDANSSQMSM